MNRTESLFVVGSLMVACSARVDRLPDAGETVRGREFILELGGKGFNVAVGAHRLGAQVDGMFAVGDDWLGRFAREAFETSGLSPHMLTQMSGPTGAGIGLIEPGGENRIAVCPAANDRLDGSHVDSLRIAAAALTVAQFEAPDAAIAAAFAMARSGGGRTLLNPSPFRPIAPDIMAATDILIVNESEARALAAQFATDNPVEQGADEGWKALARKIFRHGPTMVVVTHGARGATLHRAEGSRIQSAFPVDAIDAIGAGDAFTASFATAMAKGLGVETALRWGCGAGAMTAARLGVLDALPDLPGLTAFLAKAGAA